MTPQTAKELRGEAICWLRDQWPDAVIIPELSVATWGSARLDVAAVTMGQLIGVEIKGDGDSIGRLQLQGWAYSMVATRMFLLPSHRMRDKCEKARPPGWLMAKNSEGRWWTNGEEPNRGYGYDGKSLAHSPHRMIEMLWSDEIRYLARALDVNTNGVRGYEAIGHAIAEQIPLGVLRPKVYRLLHNRRWESGRIPKQVWRPDVSAA
jgi:hypothetical protein